MEDRVLFTSLGVTSAKPEDIERNVLDEARIQTGNGAEDEENAEIDAPRTSETADELSSSKAKLYSRLRALDFEIDAVASTVEHAIGSISGHEGGDCNADDSHLQSSDGKSNRADDGSKDDSSSISQAPFNDSTLHHALASDRLQSLKETRAQLAKELLDLQGQKVLKGAESDRFLRDLVKDKPTLKRKNKEINKAGKKLEKRKKAVSFEDDIDFDAVLDAASTGLVETERDKLVRKGLLTPFHQLKGYERRIQEPETSKRSSLPEQGASPGDHASDMVDKTVQSIMDAAQARPSTKLLDADALPKLEAPTFPFQRIKPSRISKSNRSEVENNRATGRKKKRPLPEKKWRKKISREENMLHDDMDGLLAGEASDNVVMSSHEEEKQDDSEGTVDTQTPFVMLEGGLRIPDSIFSKLFDYQKVGVQWMWELHCQRAGGIIGDEMGLGKTIQVLSFLGALHFSEMYKPSIIICPVTLLRQWKREARKWYPRFHVEILHDSANDTANRKKSSHSDESEYETEGSLDSDYEESERSRNTKKWDPLVKRVLKSQSGLLITTYEQLRLLGEKLLDIEWGYAVLDEGHRIRNPNAEITLVCKQLQTVHRIIMTGAPIQNKLSELWSLFDFVFPGKLGVLPVFEAEFAVPITVGGYANASPLQVSTAYRCAVVLRDLIMPYLLRRMKVDVNAQLPNKTEHVLFCSLTAQQRSVYRAFLASSDVEQILDGSRNSLYGIDVMRKICNHPDLLERDHSYQNPDYGNPERSGKMKVVAEVLKVWKKEGHRVLLFTQTQQMLDILENFLIAGEYTYRRMDGLTPIKQRMALMDEFNNSEDVFVFILTTKVGGLGTNLTGADRVIIFDPDWNPSTDMQARERAWRIGQTRDVTVYRLITRGTIEEKVYHRQIYKHFLTNKILKNPQQRRFFRARDMKDLFTLNDDGEKGTTETSNLFGQLAEDVNVVGTRTNGKDRGSGSTADYNKEGSVKNSPKISDSQRKGKETADNSDGEADGETDILQSLLDAHGIHSALNHDVIMDAHDEEKLKLEEQASQVAQRAAEALRQSRMLRSHDSISVPTWTGKSGSAGAPGSSRQKFGSAMNSRLVNTDSRSSDMSSNGVMAGVSAGRALSSAELIAKIRGNQERALGAALGSQTGSTSGPTESGRIGSGTSRSSKHAGHVQPEVLIRQICTFLQQRGGRTSSATIVQHFKDRIPSEDLPLFKSLLKEIATLQKSPNGSMWVLKPDYQ